MAAPWLNLPGAIPSRGPSFLEGPSRLVPSFLRQGPHQAWPLTALWAHLAWPCPTTRASLAGTGHHSRVGFISSRVGPSSRPHHPGAAHHPGGPIIPGPLATPFRGFRAPFAFLLNILLEVLEDGRGVGGCHKPLCSLCHLCLPFSMCLTPTLYTSGQSCGLDYSCNKCVYQWLGPSVHQVTPLLAGGTFNLQLLCALFTIEVKLWRSWC